MLFGAFCLKLEFAWYAIFDKKEFVEFNTKHKEFDGRGNPRHGMTANFYLERVVKPCLFALDKFVSL